MDPKQVLVKENLLNENEVMLFKLFAIFQTWTM